MVTSLAERVLAILLAVFVLVGGLWLYGRLDEVVERPDPTPYEQREGVPAAQAAVSREVEALAGRQERLKQAELAYQEARTDYEVRREEYRTALEEGRDEPALREAHDQALAAFEAERLRLQGARVLVTESETALAAAQAELDARTGRAASGFDGARRRYEGIVAGIRLAYLLAVFGASLESWRRLHRRESRWALAGMAVVVAASLQMAVMAGDYAWHHLSAYAPAVISVTGVAGTLAAILAVQRVLLNPVRLGRRRVRHNECPYCGHPLTQATPHCAGCGHLVLLPCPHCGEGHPAFSAFCPRTGARLPDPPSPTATVEGGPPGAGPGGGGRAGVTTRGARARD